MLISSRTQPCPNLPGFTGLPWSPPNPVEAEHSQVTDKGDQRGLFEQNLANSLSDPNTSLLQDKFVLQVRKHSHHTSQLEYSRVDHETWTTFEQFKRRRITVESYGHPYGEWKVMASTWKSSTCGF